MADDHSSLSGLFMHVALMVPLMAITGGAAAIPMGVETNLANSLAIGLEHTFSMLLGDPLTAAPDFFSNFTLGGDLTYEFGSMAGHHGGGAAMDMAAHASTEHVAAQSVSHSAVHAAPTGPYTEHFAEAFNGFAAEDGAIEMLAGDCDDDVLTCFSDEYYHPPEHH